MARREMERDGSLMLAVRMTPSLDAIRSRISALFHLYCGVLSSLTSTYWPIKLGTTWPCGRLLLVVLSGRGPLSTLPSSTISCRIFQNVCSRRDCSVHMSTSLSAALSFFGWYEESRLSSPDDTVGFTIGRSCDNGARKSMGRRRVSSSTRSDIYAM